MTTDRKIFDYLPRRGIMAEIEYPGVVQLIERVVWDHEAASLSLALDLGSRDRAFESPHSDQNPSEIVDFRGVFLILCLLRRKY